MRDFNYFCPNCGIVVLNKNLKCSTCGSDEIVVQAFTDITEIDLTLGDEYYSDFVLMETYTNPAMARVKRFCAGFIVGLAVFTFLAEIYLMRIGH